MAIVTIRTVIVFVCIVAAMRLMGKRQLGQLELSELVVAVLISDMAAHPLQDIGIPLLNGLIPIAVLLSCELLISWFSLKCPGFRKFCFGKPSILMCNGKIVREELKKNRFSLDELCEELRGKGVTDLSKVSFAILETDGTLNVLLRSEEKPISAILMGKSVPEPGIPITLIGDGKPDMKNLQQIHKDLNWLKSELQNYGISRISDVYFMNIDALGTIWLQKKEENA